MVDSKNAINRKKQLNIDKINGKGNERRQD